MDSRGQRLSRRAKQRELTLIAQTMNAKQRELTLIAIEQRKMERKLRELDRIGIHHHHSHHH